MDLLFTLRGDRYSSPNIVLLVVDDAAVAHAKQYPLPRRLYAEAVRKLTAAGVKTIAFDFLFSTPSASPLDDRDFIEACRQSGRVVQTTAFYVRTPGSGSLIDSVQADTGPPSPRFQMRMAYKGALPALTSVWAASALPGLQAVAPALGHVNVYPSEDGSLRTIPNAIMYRGAVYPSLALATAANYLGVAPAQIVLGNNSVSVAGRSVPLDANGETSIDWLGNGSFQTIPFDDLLRTDPRDKEAFQHLKGRIVIVGATAAASFEAHATPFSGFAPAVELQANAVDDILTNRLLRPVASWAQVVLLFVFAVLAGVVSSPDRAIAGLWRVFWLFMGLFFAALLLMARANVYLQVAAPMLAGALATILTVSINYQHEWRSNFEANTAVAALARGAGMLSTIDSGGELRTTIRDSARATLGADDVFLVTSECQYGELETPLLLQRIAGLVAQSQGTILWPDTEKRCRGRGRRARIDTANDAPDDFNELMELLCRDLAGTGALSPRWSVLAAPLPAPAADEEAAGGQRAEGGALIALAHREGAFTQRHAGLAHALARQAALAFANQRYSSILRSRIDLANRDLRGAYEVLADQTTKLAATVESVDDALVITDENGHAVFTNPASTAILRAANPALGENVETRLREHGLPAFADLLSADLPAHAGAESVERTEATVDGGDGQGQRLLSGQFTPLFGHENQLVGGLLTIADITAQRELDSAKSDFVSFVAHELRTPLTTILGYTSLLQEDTGNFSGAQRAEMTGAIMGHCRRLNRMITELLDISRAEAGHDVALRLDTFDIVELLEATIAAQEAAMGKHDEYFLFLDTAGKLEIEADRDRIEQVFTNLLSNAVKYSPDGGSIRVTVHQNEGKIMIAVEDQGMGMTPEQVERLFEKYYRTPQAMQSGIRGTGLGLYLVKRLIQAHRGSIEVQSQPHQGTRVTVTLPVHCAQN